MAKLWGGRFNDAVDPQMEALNRSIGFDARLWEVNIRGSQAWAQALLQAGGLSEEECLAIITGLDRVYEEWARGDFVVQPEDEDIHTAIERRLTELVGPVGGKLHTGRSRNDQVATDVRLYLLDAADTLETHLSDLQRALVEQAERYIDLIMPGYTHLQPAQPVRFAQWLLSYFWMLQGDWTRLEDLRRRVDEMPLGAGALAGTPLAVDREALAERLGFSRVSMNSMDAVADRDFVAEFLFWAAMVGVHLSRLILFSNPALGFVRLSDAYSTGSSLMPQKKNPDACELARGKSGRLIGRLTGFLSTLKGLPSTYNKDLQEDKEPLFDAIDTLDLVLPVMTGVILTMQPQGERMAAALDDFLLATDLADWLVQQGMPFRQSHHVVGEVVRLAEERGCALRQLSVEDLQSVHPAFGPEALTVWDFERSVEQRAALGGVARATVLQQIQRARLILGLGD